MLQDALEPPDGTAPLLTRRELLAAGAAGATGLLLAACSSATSKVVSTATTTCPAGPHLADIDHVVVIVQENRSFDHYFGRYPGVRGFDDHPADGPGPFAQPDPRHRYRSGVVLPWHLDTATTTAECVVDPDHDWASQHACWNGGAMDAFVATHVREPTPDRPWGEGDPNGYAVMGYYDRTDLPFHYALADRFTVCDSYHCSVLGPTDPNRLMSMSAYIDPAGTSGGPVIHTGGGETPASPKFSRTWTTMPERLSATGVSWKIYNQGGIQNGPYSLLVSNNVMGYFAQCRDPSTELARNAFGYEWPGDLVTDVARHQLPQVSWVLAPLGADEHPPSAPAVGAAFLSQVLATLSSDPVAWARTVVFITYDENGGFFDHVPPPTPPEGTPGEWITADPPPAGMAGVRGPIGLGARVPMLVVSPFATGGYVCSDTFDHTSLLRFLESRFGVEVPNLSPWRRSVTGDLTTALGPSTPSPSTASTPPVAPDQAALVAAECPADQISGTPGVLLPPRIQTMPAQAPGVARRRRPACP